jgi:hypothetical protein
LLLQTPPAEPAAPLASVCETMSITGEVAPASILASGGQGPTAEETATALIIQSLSRGRITLHPSLPLPAARPPNPLAAASAALTAALLAEPVLLPPLASTASAMTLSTLRDLLRPLLAISTAQRAFFASNRVAQEECDVRLNACWP